MEIYYAILVAIVDGELFNVNTIGSATVVELNTLTSVNIDVGTVTVITADILS